MSKLDNFKKFVSNHPEFIDSVRQNNTTWQKLYELYDLYGENEKIWQKYLKTDIKESIDVKGILNTMKNINLDSLEENISSIQKAVQLVEELTSKPTEKSVKNVHEEKIDSLYGEKE